ncbi:unnamed protein product [Didymodactylos carnosus]|uniref:Microsomal glutathione S-transferase 1 n=1 Tax=Didymodactylos carnosus TaxID=1234261 RepID=A0A814V1T6_9BILA|nr:unnamed protein product [Didymodactylos carnosus]CAF1182197.1 unnamed protein product [Didymodactylos carnosus]CAF3663890.1 unnamed protein product [Didymodactylos carnosus]CAF3946578.1 unnamed protein product [Didymodactylos carnosus]
MLHYSCGAFNDSMSNGLYSFTNPAFVSFAGYSTAAVLKMFGIAAYTIGQRFRTKTFATPEDDVYKQLVSSLLGSESGLDGGSGARGRGRDCMNAVVERVRGNHLNDLENIIPFVLIGLFYVGTQPKYDCALWHYRLFLLSRLVHTIAYQVPLPQPTRTLSWLIGYATTISMALRVFKIIIY